MATNNILDLPRDQFLASLNELAAQGVNTDELMRQYRRANSPFSGFFDWAINSERDIANEGRTTAGAGLLSKEAGTTGMDALASARIEPANFIAGLLSGGAQAVDAAGATLKGLVPAADMPMEALGTAGMAMTGGAASMGRGVFDYDPTVARAIYGGSVDDALSLAKSGDAIFHSGNASIADDIHKYGVEPTNTGAWIAEVAAGAVDDLDEFLSQNPSVSWWADAPDWVKATAARAAGKHVSDLTDEDIRKFGHLSIARGSDWGDEVFRIPEEGLDNGEYSYVTDLLGNRQRLYETPLYEYGDDGVGRYPFGIERNELVTSANIDPEFTLTGDELVDFLNRYNTTSANRDATTGAIALPAARNEAERMARQILEMRAAGRAGDVTDAMMAQADPQYMFNNTPLPMDEASRMARAGEMGFDTRVYHGSRDDITSMDQLKGSAEGGAGTLFSSDEARVANTYATKRLGSEGENVLPLLANVSDYGESGYKTPFPFNGSDIAIEQWLTGLDRFNRTLDNSKTSYFENAIRSARNAGQAGTVIRQVEDDAVSSMTTMPSDVHVTLDPTTIRSRFARFDPEFSHLANLNAANASPLAGILAMPNEEERNRQLGMLFGGYR